MVFLSRIYTKTGDHGETSLGDGVRVPKTHPRIAAYGSVDELNAVLGVARIVAAGAANSRLGVIQNDLFDLGADLCVPESSDEFAPQRLRVTAEQVLQLEAWLDEDTARLQPLTSFILPGGNPAAAHLHVARTVCRRAEIAVLHLHEHAAVNLQAMIYLNRLSDLLFVMARCANKDGADDVLWRPGGR